MITSQQPPAFSPCKPTFECIVLAESRVAQVCWWSFEEPDHDSSQMNYWGLFLDEGVQQQVGVVPNVLQWLSSTLIPTTAQCPCIWSSDPSLCPGCPSSPPAGPPSAHAAAQVSAAAAAAAAAAREPAHRHPSCESVRRWDAAVPCKKWASAQAPGHAQQEPLPECNPKPAAISRPNIMGSITLTASTQQATALSPHPHRV